MRIIRKQKAVTLKLQLFLIYNGKTVSDSEQLPQRTFQLFL